MNFYVSGNLWQVFWWEINYISIRFYPIWSHKRGNLKGFTRRFPVLCWFNVSRTYPWRVQLVLSLGRPQFSDSRKQNWCFSREVSFINSDPASNTFWVFYKQLNVLHIWLHIYRVFSIITLSLPSYCIQFILRATDRITECKITFERLDVVVNRMLLY